MVKNARKRQPAPTPARTFGEALQTQWSSHARRREMRLNRLMLQMITLIALSIYLGLASWSLAFAGPCEGDVPEHSVKAPRSQADITVPATERTAVVTTLPDAASGTTGSYQPNTSGLRRRYFHALPRRAAWSPSHSVYEAEQGLHIPTVQGRHHEFTK